MTESHNLNFTPLGAGCEVGRSCMYLSHKSTRILFDIGIHPAHLGVCGFPFLDLIDLSTVDALFVTHFHLDHCGGLPFLTEKTNFKGKIYMTHATKAILVYLLNDYTRIVNASSSSDFYTEQDLVKCYSKIQAIDYHQEVRVKDLKITPLNAGHVLGAAMFMIKTKSKEMLYTGDYSTEEDRHLKAAEPPGKINYLVCESTYGVQCHLPRSEREKRFVTSVKDILRRGGKVLLPVFALGRAQEILLILEEFWELNKEMRKIPIYYISALAKRCIGIYQTYAQTSKDVNFHFKYVTNINHYEETNLPCVVMASPGMLQSGLSREIFEKWCEDSRNGVIIAGYCVQGTLAKEILSEPDEVEGMNGNILKLNCSVDSISFSAHVDYIQNKSFITECDPEFLFLVHGESNEMNRLKLSLKRENIYCLKNGENYEIVITKEKMCRIRNMEVDRVFEGIIRGSGDDYEILDVEEVKQVEIFNRVRIRNIDLIIKENLEKERLRMLSITKLEENCLEEDEKKNENFDEKILLNIENDDDINKKGNLSINKYEKLSKKILEEENMVTEKLDKNEIKGKEGDFLTEISDKSHTEENEKLNEITETKENIYVELYKDENLKNINANNDLNDTKGIDIKCLQTEGLEFKSQGNNVNEMENKETEEKEIFDFKNKSINEKSLKDNESNLFEDKNHEKENQNNDYSNEIRVKQNHKDQENDIKVDEEIKNKENKPTNISNSNLKNHEISNNIEVKNKDTTEEKNQYLLSYKHLPYNSKFSLIKTTLLDFFDDIKTDENIIKIEGLSIYIKDENIFLEWKSNYVNDLLARTVSRIIKSIGMTIESVKLSSLSKDESLWTMITNSYYDVTKKEDTNEIVVRDGIYEVRIKDGKNVVGEESGLKEKIENIVANHTLIFNGNCC